MLAKIKALIAGVANAYIGTLPASPDAVVCIYPSGGNAASLTGAELREPSFQIRVRDADYAAGYATAEALQRTLHGIHSTADFLLIAQEGDIQHIGPDKLGRPEFTVNFRTIYKG